MSKPQDGLVSRYLNRPISRFVTRGLLKLPIHPNAWTISIFVLPLLASVFLMRGNYASVIVGAGLFQIYSILDGCDGEIARAKNLESKFGARLDNFSDFIASILFVIALGFGLQRSGEGILCAAFIAGNEFVLKKSEGSGDSGSVDNSIYPRHRGMIEHSGLLNLGENFTWWVLQLTKRDVAILMFFILALMNRATWILHLWLVVAAVSLILSGVAAIRTRRTLS